MQENEGVRASSFIFLKKLNYFHVFICIYKIYMYLCIVIKSEKQLKNLRP